MPDYDAFLLVSFGGPEGRRDVIPFLENVTRGRGIPAGRLAAVAEHYYAVGGVSPINQQCRDLLAAIGKDFAAAGLDLPVYWGNRNWDPYLATTVAEMAGAGIRRALAFVTSAYGSYSSCRQYRDDIEQARAEAGPGAPEIEKLRHFYNHPGFIEPFADATVQALQALPPDVRGPVPLVFTAHSVPEAMAAASGPPPGGRYPAQLAEAARLVADRVNAARPGQEAHPWRLVYQSRSGPPSQPWLGPDVCDYLEELAAARRPGRRARPGRLHLRPHGGHPRPGRRGGADRPAARPAAGPRGDAGNRPALRLDDHRAGERAAGRLGDSRQPWARWARPGFPALTIAAVWLPRRTVPAVRRAHDGPGGRPGPSRATRAGPGRRRRGRADAGRPPAGRPGRPAVAGTKSSPTDVVTEMDRAAETLISERIRAERPGDAILGEEGGQSGQGRVRWIVDPLDGTVNYLYGLADWAVSIAAEVAGQVVAGVVAVPRHAEVFTAVAGQGSWLHPAGGAPVRLRCNTGVPLSRALVATGFGYGQARRVIQGEVAAAVLPLVRDIRRGGSCAVDLCSVAAGRVDAYYERGVNYWDYAAGGLIATEAGARLGGLSGRPPSSELAIAADPGLVRRAARPAGQPGPRARRCVSPGGDPPEPSALC